MGLLSIQEKLAIKLMIAYRQNPNFPSLSSEDAAELAFEDAKALVTKFDDVRDAEDIANMHSEESEVQS